MTPKATELHRRLFRRKGDVESQPSWLIDHNVDVTPVPKHGVLDDSKAESSPPEASGPAFFQSVEPLEEMGDMDGRYTASVIGDRD